MDRMINGTSILVLPSKLSTSIFKIPPYSDLYKILDHPCIKQRRMKGEKETFTEARPQEALFAFLRLLGGVYEFTTHRWPAMDAQRNAS